MMRYVTAPYSSSRPSTSTNTRLRRLQRRRGVGEVASIEDGARAAAGASCPFSTGRDGTGSFGMKVIPQCTANQRNFQCRQPPTGGHWSNSEKTEGGKAGGGTDPCRLVRQVKQFGG